MRWLVYKHISPCEQVSLGITQTSPETRWAKGFGYRKCILFYRAILKYGWDNIEHKVLIDNLTEHEAKDIERQLISYYKSKGKSYNITDGGDGILGKHHSAEVRKRMSEAAKGRDMSKALLARIKNANYENTYRRRIAQYDLNGNYINEFTSIQEAMKFLNKTSKAIQNCLAGRTKTAFGYIWKYKEDVK